MSNREIVPLDQTQQPVHKSFNDLTKLTEWLTSLTRTQGAGPDQSILYCFHIDHIQIFPPSANNSRYEVIAIYHRVYLGLIGNDELSRPASKK